MEDSFKLYAGNIWTYGIDTDLKIVDFDQLIKSLNFVVNYNLNVIRENHWSSEFLNEKDHQTWINSWSTCQFKKLEHKQGDATFNLGDVFVKENDIIVVIDSILAFYSFEAVLLSFFKLNYESKNIVGILNNNRNWLSQKELFYHLSRIRNIQFERSFALIFFDTHPPHFESTIQTNRIEILFSKGETDEEDLVVREIIFEPNQLQAGLGILSFFSEYLSRNYPNEKASVKILQEGLKVRLVIENEYGETEQIQKALSEYGLIISGQKQPEEFTKDKLLVLDLKNEIRILETRIESKNDQLKLMGASLDDANKIIAMLGTALETKSSVIINPSIAVNPQITVNQESSIDIKISQQIGELNKAVFEICRTLPSDEPQKKELQSAAQALEATENKSPESVKNSPYLMKIGKFLQDLNDEKSTTRKTLAGVKNGIDMAKKIAGKYNSIAEWCGLPQVPKIFTL